MKKTYTKDAYMRRYPTYLIFIALIFSSVAIGSCDILRSEKGPNTYHIQVSGYVHRQGGTFTPIDSAGVYLMSGWDRFDKEKTIWGITRTGSTGQYIISVICEKTNKDPILFVYASHDKHNGRWEPIQWKNSAQLADLQLDRHK